MSDRSPRVTAADVIRVLERLGFQLVRQRVEATRYTGAKAERE